VGVYVLSVVVGLALHVGVTLPLVFYWYTGGMNPYTWLYAIRQPLIVAFSTASSAATLPVSIKTAVESGLVEETTANTLLPLGATINM
jgi:proton glutamate symport protein